MALSQQHIDNLEKSAIEAIHTAYGSGDAEGSVAQFVDQCLDEVDHDFWEKYLDAASATPEQVLGLLELSSHWTDGADEIFEFTLPENIIFLVLSVHIDEEGKTVDIALDR